jgi:hypothetical protein
VVGGFVGCAGGVVCASAGPTVIAVTAATTISIFSTLMK